MSFHVSNYTLHIDVQIKTVQKMSSIIYKLYRSQLENHPIPQISALDSDKIHGNPQERFKRRWCFP